MSEENTKQQTFEYVSNAEMKAKWGLKDSEPTRITLRSN